MTGRMAGDIFKPPNFMQQRENYQDHAVIGMKNRAEEQAQAFASEAQVQGYGLAAAGQVAAAEAEAEAIAAAGQANGQAAMFGGAMDAFSGLGGAMAGNLKLGKGLFG
jgi:regulator of protease activity HflC (stomatin/prohibitin superfamily)